MAGSFEFERSLAGERTRRINAKSIMGVMMLAAGKGSTIVVETDR
jgi:phosphocarrier protein HPr